MAEALTQQNDFSEILRLVSTNTVRVFGAYVASVLMINPRTQDTVKTIIREAKARELKGWQVLQTNITGWMMVNAQSFFSEDIRRDTRFAEDLFPVSPFGAVIGVALRAGGSLLGFLLTGNFTENSAVSNDDFVLPKQFALLVVPHLGNTQKIQEYFQPELPETALLERYAAAGMPSKSPAVRFLQIL